MRVAVLPRDVAAAVITGGLTRSIWVVNAATLALAIPLVIAFALLRDGAGWLGGPLAILVGLLALTIAVAFRPTPVVVVGYLVVAAVAAVAFELLLITAYPAIVHEGFILLNRPAVALMLVSVASATWLSGLIWIVVGFLVSVAVSATVGVISGIGMHMGWGPTFMLLLYGVLFLSLGGIQRSQRRRVPNFDELERETSRLATQEHLQSRIAAVMHDTLLNDLSIVMNAPTVLDERTRKRLREDIQTLSSSPWLTRPDVIIDKQDVHLRNRIMQIVSDLQWRGLTVNVTGSGSGIYRLEPEVATAMLDTAAACLENVLRHSGVTSADLDLAYDDTSITVIVTDQGIGFDSDKVPEDRLGLRISVIDRIAQVGGTTRIWSSPGQGTSVVMRLPVMDVIARHEESDHGAA